MFRAPAKYRIYLSQPAASRTGGSQHGTQRRRTFRIPDLSRSTAPIPGFCGIHDLAGHQSRPLSRPDLRRDRFLLTTADDWYLQWHASIPQDRVSLLHLSPRHGGNHRGLRLYRQPVADASSTGVQPDAAEQSRLWKVRQNTAAGQTQRSAQT